MQRATRCRQSLRACVQRVRALRRATGPRCALQQGQRISALASVEVITFLVLVLRLPHFPYLSLSGCFPLPACLPACFPSFLPPSTAPQKVMILDSQAAFPESLLLLATMDPEQNFPDAHVPNHESPLRSFEHVNNVPRSNHEHVHT